MKNNALNTDNNLNLPANDNRYKPPLFDPSLFTNDLTGYDITEQERIELLTILWSMMVSCVDKGFGSDATNLICGKLIKTAFEDAADSPHTIESTVQTNTYAMAP